MKSGIRIFGAAIGLAALSLSGWAGAASSTAADSVATKAVETSKKIEVLTQAVVTPTRAVAANLSVKELLQNAGTSITEGRLVQPRGNNAVEYYLAALSKDPGNRIAKDGLSEMFPLAADAIEQQINRGKIEESRRSIELLAKADPNNHTLTILREKLQQAR